jgi:hypothetical protein
MKERKRKEARKNGWDRARKEKQKKAITLNVCSKV